VLKEWKGKPVRAPGRYWKGITDFRREDAIKNEFIDASDRQLSPGLQSASIDIGSRNDKT
jgi:hypothetical protein